MASSDGGGGGLDTGALTLGELRLLVDGSGRMGMVGRISVIENISLWYDAQFKNDVTMQVDSSGRIGMKGRISVIENKNLWYDAV